TKAFCAASAGQPFSYQKPIKRYEHRPTPSQPTKSPSRLDESTRISIANTNRFRYAKNFALPGSCAMYPIEYTWIRNPTPVITSSITLERRSTTSETSTEKAPAEIQCQAGLSSTPVSGMPRSAPQAEKARPSDAATDAEPRMPAS